MEGGLPKTYHRTYSGVHYCMIRKVTFQECGESVSIPQLQNKPSDRPCLYENSANRDLASLCLKVVNKQFGSRNIIQTNFIGKTNYEQEVYSRNELMVYQNSNPPYDTWKLTVEFTWILDPQKIYSKDECEVKWIDLRHTHCGCVYPYYQTYTYNPFWTPKIHAIALETYLTRIQLAKKHNNYDEELLHSHLLDGESFNDWSKEADRLQAFIVRSIVNGVTRIGIRPLSTKIVTNSDNTRLAYKKLGEELERYCLRRRIHRKYKRRLELKIKTLAEDYFRENSSFEQQ